MRRLALIVSAVIVVVGCGTRATRVNGPDGQGTWYSITCKRSRANCLEKASEVCPGGYDTENSSDQKGIKFDNNPVTGASVQSTYDGQMLVKCR